MEQDKPTGRQLSRADEFKSQLEKVGPVLATALPPQIPKDRFLHVVRTAVNRDPQLLLADRQSLWNAAMIAASDGLLPDGRDGAFVIFRSKEGADKVQFLPMIAGILKKVRNSGELVSIRAHVVYEADDFSYILGDEESIEHRPSLSGDRGQPIAAYAIAELKAGGIEREVMTVEQIEKVRAISRARNSGPWQNWWDEMARKTVLRRLSKRLPMSTDLDALMRRDDELYEPGEAPPNAPRASFRPLANPLSDVEPIEAEPADRGKALAAARADGREARRQGGPKIPPQPVYSGPEGQEEAAEWVAGWNEGEEEGRSEYDEP